LAVGVTVIVAVTAVVPVLTAVNPGVLPLPLAAKPIVAFEFVHVNVVPPVLLVKADAATAPPLQTVMFAGTTTLGLGLTVIVYVCAGPGQPPAVGVTVIVAVTGAVPVFTAVKPGVFPEPEAARPIAVLLFVQAKVVVPTLLVNAEAATEPPLHTVMFAGTTTFGTGSTVIV
jgi:hypothetical protein